MAQSDWYIQPSAGRFVAVQAQADAVASLSFLTPILSRQARRPCEQTRRAAMEAGGDELST